MTLAISIGVPTGATITEQLEFIERAERSGFAGVGTADHLRYGQDAFVTLAAAAGRTSRIILHPAITNPVVRSPAVLAGLANSLAQLAPGRTKLAIGAGDQSAVEAGVSPATLAQFREAVVSIRRLLHGEEVTFGTAPPLTLGNIADPPPPVVVTASGPKTIQTGAEVADELLLFVGVDASILEAAMDHVATGAERAGRTVADVPITHYVFASVADNEASALERTRYWLDIWLTQGLFNVGLKALGIEPPESTDQRNLSHDELRRLASAFFIVGTPEQAVEQLLQLQARGAQRVFCMLPGGTRSQWEATELFAERVLPALR
ncbi:MAG: LLM class flavin-dependent oxidoreductase [Dehalococcoidia bacterium]